MAKRSRRTSQEGAHQKLTAVAKVEASTDGDALLLGLLGFSATKLYNAAKHHRDCAWNEGKPTSFAEQCRELKGNRWYRLLPSQTAQEILAELDDGYRSFFAHRKNGNAQARPPGFRRKDTLSTLTIKQKAFELLPGSRIRLRLPRTYGRRTLALDYCLPRDAVLGRVQQVKLVFDRGTGEWYLHMNHRVPVKYREEGEVMALDLGEVNLVAGLVTDGLSFLVPGGELLALDRYFHKEKAKCNKSSSRRSRELNRKWGRQRAHFLHCASRLIVDLAASRGVSVIVVGGLKGIRRGKDWGAVGNQKLHAWPFAKLVALVTYKAALKGIRVVTVPEQGTSTTCPACGRRAKSARVERGLFLRCGEAFNADLVGAYNIMRRYLREAGPGSCPVRSGVVGALARPAVNLFVWRKTTPKGREQGTFRQAA